MHKVFSKVRKGILISAGFLFVSMGIIGIFVPLLPTTVFLLMAAYCFARSSDRFYNSLLNNKWFGSYIKNYREKKGVTVRVKIVSISLLWITILYSAIFVVQNIYIRILLMGIAIAVTIHLLSIKTFKPEVVNIERQNRMKVKN